MRLQALRRWGSRALLVVLACATWLCATGPARAACSDKACPVRVKARIDGKYFTSSGFFWKGEKATYVVTALHGVIGAQTIYVKPEGSGADTEVRIAMGHKASDLALLVPTAATPWPDSVALRTAPFPDKYFGGKFWVVGYPARVQLPRRALTEFHTSAQPVTLTQYFDKELVDELCAAGYPARDTSVFTVGSVFDPGHSGSPVVDEQDRVVAIADGSLARTEGHRSNWAIPAAQYLAVVESSGQPGSAFAHAPANAAMRYYVSAEAGPAPVLENAHTSLIPAGTFPLDVLLDGYDATMQSEINAYLKATGSDARSVSYDVYEASLSGELLMVPAGSSVSAQRNSFRVTSSDRSVSAVVSIRSQAGQAGDDASDGLLREIRGRRTWEDVTFDDEMRPRRLDPTQNERDGGLVLQMTTRSDGTARVLFHLRDTDTLATRGGPVTDVKSIVLLADLASPSDKIPPEFFRFFLGLFLSMPDGRSDGEPGAAGEAPPDPNAPIPAF
jgi:S1-C subfamily serine protease